MTIDVQTILENVTSPLALSGARVEFAIKEDDRNTVEVDFTVRGKKEFCFWNYYPRSTDAPMTHPAWSGKKLGFLVDGNMGVIAGHALRCVLPPEETIARPNALGWSGMRHPYKAAGQTFRARLLTAKLLTPKGEEELHSLLRILLGLNNAYVAVANYTTR